jgi:hypothetical protein
MYVLSPWERLYLTSEQYGGPRAVVAEVASGRAGGPVWLLPKRAPTPSLLLLFVSVPLWGRPCGAAIAPRSVVTCYGVWGAVPHKNLSPGLSPRTDALGTGRSNEVKRKRACVFALVAQPSPCATRNNPKQS